MPAEFFGGGCFGHAYAYSQETEIQQHGGRVGRADIFRHESAVCCICSACWCPISDENNKSSTQAVVAWSKRSTAAWMRRCVYCRRTGYKRRSICPVRCRLAHLAVRPSSFPCNFSSKKDPAAILVYTPIARATEVSAILRLAMLIDPSRHSVGRSEGVGEPRCQCRSEASIWM